MSVSGAERVRERERGREKRSRCVFMGDFNASELQCLPFLLDGIFIALTLRLGVGRIIVRGFC